MEWFKSSERPPDPNMPVLVVDESGDKSAIRVGKYLKSPYPKWLVGKDIKDRATFEATGTVAPRELEQITYWMPIPEAPTSR